MIPDQTLVFLSSRASSSHRPSRPPPPPPIHKKGSFCVLVSGHGKSGGGERDVIIIPHYRFPIFLGWAELGRVTRAFLGALVVVSSRWKEGKGAGDTGCRGV